MNKILVTIITALFASSAFAAVRPFYQDIKLPNQVVLEAQTITTPILAAASYVVAASAGATSAAAATLSTFTNQPDVARNITITPVGTTTDVESCVIVVNGLDIVGKSISENFTFAANASTVQTGNKAFKSVVSVVFPANCESGSFGATWNVGVGSKLGLKRCMANAGDVFKAVFNGANETIGTVAASASAASGNTYIPTGTLDGSKSVLLYFVQNFAMGCQP